MIHFHDIIVRLRPTLIENRGGDLVEDWTAPAEHTIVGVSVQPAQQAEATDVTRTATTTGWTVQSQPGVDLDVVASDRIRYDGMTCRVVGEVARWTDPLTGVVHHVDFTIERRAG